MEKMEITYPIIVGGICGLTGFAVALTGYGYSLYYMRLFLWGGFVFLAIPALLRKKPLEYAIHLAIIAGLASGLWYAGTATRRFSKVTICHELNGLIDQAQDYHELNGYYPETLNNLSFSTERSLNTGFMRPSGIGLDGMNGHDATVYLSTNTFACIVPVTKVLPMSITRFYVYRWTSDEPEWEYDKIIWTLRAL